MLALRAKGFAVSVPFGENTRYDLIIDDGIRLSRVQCKTGRLRNGAVVFPACSTYRHHANPRTADHHYLGQIDYFAVYWPRTGAVYLIPIEDAAVKVSGALRVGAPRNGQRRKVRFAGDYQIASIPLGSPTPATSEDATGEPDETAGAR
ncbi:MAG: group I intron-associated PD-(D/E)XK endonuclease [Actinomycetota bacterium]|nr:group I intron-associated PD-(D/E)XK endonuclease [Actinomycetota bacterium]